MRVYLDDDIIDGILIRLLRAAGHDVVLPHEFGRAGAVDPVHLTEAIRAGRVLITGNGDDFEALHLLVLQSGGRHPGVLVVRRENNSRRDMSQRGIVNAIRKLTASSFSLTDQFVDLNHWR